MDAGGQRVTGDGPYTDPRWAYPEYPPGSVVELRVHGVGGQPPSGMSRDPHPRLVGGGELAGFWRSRNPVVGSLGAGGDAGEPGPDHVREVLAWGGQTSGTWRHAFWVLLAPFAVFNLAGRMHPDDPDSWRSVAHRGLCRLLAYTMTLAVVALSVGVALDLVGVQCAGMPACLGSATEQTGPVVLAPVRWFAADPVARLALLALVPVVVVLLLWWAGRYATDELEGLEDPEPPESGEAAATEPVRVQDPGFWHNAWPTSRLRSIHASGAFGFLTMTVALVLLDLAPEQQWMWWRWMLAVGAGAVVAGGVLVAAPVTVGPGRSRALQHAQWVLRLLAVGPGTVALALALLSPVPLGGWAWAVAAVGAGLVVRWVGREWPEPPGPDDGRPPDTTIGGNLWLLGGAVVLAASLQPAVRALEVAAVQPALGELQGGLAGLPVWLAELAPGLYVPAYLLLVPLVALQALLLVGLVATSLQRTLARRADAFQLDGRAFPLNLGAVVVALLALLVLTAAGGSVHAGLLDALGDRLVPGGKDTPEVGLVLPWWYALTAVVTAVVLPLLLVGAGGLRVLLRRFGPPAARAPSPDEVAEDLARGLDALTGGPVPAPSDEEDRARLGALGTKWLTQLLVRDAPRVLTGAVLVATALVVAGLWIIVAAPTANIERFTEIDVVTTAAIWAMAALFGAAVGLVRTGLSARSTRRQVGALWDVLTFWPRVTHPFAPPCYGEAIVPMLSQRIRELTEHPDGYRVLLAGHSQGSVVGLAAAAAGPGPAGSLALVAYGSPITVLYERVFRGVFGPVGGAIEAGRRRTSSWHHLFAMTEPFAFPFWAVEPAGEVHDQAAARAGWGLSRLAPHPDVACPACGWSPGGRQAAPAPGGRRDADYVVREDADYVVTDPDRWLQPLDPDHPEPAGHASYHHHREVDLHLAHIAGVLAGRHPHAGLGRP